MSTSIGKILITPKGDFVDNTTYEILDVVLYNGSSYISKINNNTLPVDDTDG